MGDLIKRDSSGLFLDSAQLEGVCVGVCLTESEGITAASSSITMLELRSVPVTHKLTGKVTFGRERERRLREEKIEAKCQTEGDASRTGGNFKDMTNPEQQSGAETSENI